MVAEELMRDDDDGERDNTRKGTEKMLKDRV